MTIIVRLELPLVTELCTSNPLIIRWILGISSFSDTLPDPGLTPQECYYKCRWGYLAELKDLYTDEASEERRHQAQERQEQKIVGLEDSGKREYKAARMKD